MQLYTYYQTGAFKAEVAIPDETPAALIAQAQEVSAYGGGILVVIGENLDGKETRIGNIFAFNGSVVFQNVTGEDSKAGKTAIAGKT